MVNGRILGLRSNGQRRVTEELLSRLSGLRAIRPSQPHFSGIYGHAWEQVVLPIMAYGKPLWSPSTSGPILHPNHIVTIHDLAFIDIPDYFSKSFASWYSGMSRAVATTARHIATVSQFSADRIMMHFRIPPAKISVIYSGVASAFHIRRSDEISQVLDRYNLRNTSYVVGFSGTDRRKNTLGLLKAWTLTGAAQKGHKLVLFGRCANPAVFGVQPLVAPNEGVVPIGAVDDDVLACIYSGARGLVFPSYYEGFGLPVVEAARCGCRVVTSQITALPEICPRDSLLIDPNDTHQIADAISHLLSGDFSASSQRQRSCEMERFDWNVAAQQYTTMFKNSFG
jgi:glycosyltransferase involved in cell wall biosynthesis